MDNLKDLISKIIGSDSTATFISKSKDLYRISSDLFAMKPSELPDKRRRYLLIASLSFVGGTFFSKFIQDVGFSSGGSLDRETRLIADKVHGLRFDDQIAHKIREYRNDKNKNEHYKDYVERSGSEYAVKLLRSIDAFDGNRYIGLNDLMYLSERIDLLGEIESRLLVENFLMDVYIRYSDRDGLNSILGSMASPTRYWRGKHVERMISVPIITLNSSQFDAPETWYTRDQFCIAEEFLKDYNINVADDRFGWHLDGDLADKSIRIEDLLDEYSVSGFYIIYWVIFSSLSSGFRSLKFQEDQLGNLRHLVSRVECHMKGNTPYRAIRNGTMFVAMQMHRRGRFDLRDEALEYSLGSSVHLKDGDEIKKININGFKVKDNASMAGQIFLNKLILEGKRINYEVPKFEELESPAIPYVPAAYRQEIGKYIKKDKHRIDDIVAVKANGMDDGMFKIYSQKLG